MAINDPIELDFRDTNVIISKNAWYESFSSSVDLSVLQGDRGLQGERGFKGMRGDMGDPGTPGLAVSSFSHYNPSFECEYQITLYIMSVVISPFREERESRANKGSR